MDWGMIFFQGTIMVLTDSLKLKQQNYLKKHLYIYLSRTEISFASKKVKDFFLYRVFNFDANPRIFIKNGEYGSFCKLTPQIFKGYF